MIKSERRMESDRWSSCKSREECERNTYDLRTALSLAGSTLAVAVVLTSGHGRSDGSEGGKGSEDGLELHFEVCGLGKLKS